MLGVAWLAKVPVKKALAGFGLVELTTAEGVFYYLGCLFIGAAYFKKIAVAKALTELPAAKALRQREVAPVSEIIS